MKIALLFPGYGSQYVGMAKELYDESRIVQEYFEQASHCLNTNFVQLCFASSDTQLNILENAYPALFLVSCAIYALLKQEGIKADLLAGLPIGHYAALYAAGSITFADGLYFLHKYAILYTDFLKGLAVRCLRIKGIKTSQVQALCERYTGTQCASVAVYLDAKECIISGHTNLIDSIEAECKTYKDVTLTDVNPGVGLHSSMMQPVVDQLKTYMPKIDFRTPATPVVSTITGKKIKKSTQVTDWVLEQITQPVRWDLVLKSLKAYDLSVQVGPSTDLNELKHILHNHESGS